MFSKHAAAVGPALSPSDSSRHIRVRTVRLSDATRDEIERRFAQLQCEESAAGENASPYDAYPRLAPAVGAIVEELLPRHVRALLMEQVLYGSPDAILLRNCPVSARLGPTPDDDKQSPLKGFVEEYFQLALIHLRCGRLYHERHEKHGEAFAQVLSARGYEDATSSRGSRVELDYHTEQCYMDHVIDFLLLSCIRGDPCAATTFVSDRSLLSGLPEWVIEGMQQLHFSMSQSAVWGVPQPPLIAAMLEPDLARPGSFHLRFNTDLVHRVKPINDEGARVIEHLKAHLSKGLLEDRIVLERGDCVIFNNRHVLHGRCAYERSTSWDERRWLVRAFERTDWRRILLAYQQAPTAPTPPAEAESETEATKQCMDSSVLVAAS